MIIACFFKTIFRTIFSFPYITSGHDYIEIYNNKDIQVLKCEICNHVSLGYKGE